MKAHAEFSHRLAWIARYPLLLLQPHTILNSKERLNGPSYDLLLPNYQPPHVEFG